MAAGYGGQIVASFTEIDLIIVITSNAEPGRMRDPRYLINKFIKNVFNEKKV